MIINASSRKRNGGQMTPLKAIRLKCRWCCLDQVHEIQLCHSEKSCPVWPLRFGKGVRGMSPLKAIRAKCLDCVGSSPSEVKACEQASGICALWPFRFGTNPNFSEATREKRKAARLKFLHEKGAPRRDSDTNADRAV
jgi:hypothetical protein